MTAFDKRLPGLHPLQQHFEDARGHLLCGKRACHALGGIGLHSGIVAAVQKPEELKLSFARPEYQGRVGGRLLQWARTEE
ncbi:hypothetical protein [Streptomyces sp. NBC_01092]|uniref:hypothetical protein n=1 Tax=Streptomyces sp. NBC_01092 TaxID=2903748 RepID=UPI003867FAFF|nr:hypothetical protein OG254_43795 [Streptomyces sp. NBC_01092]